MVIINCMFHKDENFICLLLVEKLLKNLWLGFCL